MEYPPKNLELALLEISIGESIPVVYSRELGAAFYLNVGFVCILTGSSSDSYVYVDTSRSAVTVKFSSSQMCSPASSATPNAAVATMGYCIGSISAERAAH